MPEELLHGHAIPSEGDCYLQATGWDVADSCLDIVGDPFHNIAAILALCIERLLISLLHGHLPVKDNSRDKVMAVAGVTGSHHVLDIKDLLGEFGHSEGLILVASMASQRGRARREEVERWRL